MARKKGVGCSVKSIKSICKKFGKNSKKCRSLRKRCKK